MIIPKRSVFALLLLGSLGTLPLPTSVEARASQIVQQDKVAKGKVTLSTGEPAIGAVVYINGTKKFTTVGNDGSFVLRGVKKGETLKFTLIGYDTHLARFEGAALNVVLKEKENMIEGAVVTAMGIRRKAKSLTYATQKINADDLMKVQDQNVANSLEGKVAGVTITPSAGGAGGASKIILRGNKSINGNSSPLIVIDGVPMTNNIQNQQGGEGFGYIGASEGGDALSMLNPDDIESMNVLKGANAAALYGSQAANGVLMITTKKGKEGRLDVNYVSNVTFDKPLLTPDLQGIYGADVSNGKIGIDGWGGKIVDSPLETNVALGGDFITKDHKVHLRNHNNDDVADFYRTGYTVNNSLSLSGGTAKSRTYFSAANTHAKGMIEQNSYNRNTLNFRQNYKFFDRLNVDVALNYAETITRNRPGGGTVLNPIYHLYMTPRNIDMGYYRNNYATQGKWYSDYQGYYKFYHRDLFEEVLDDQGYPTGQYEPVSVSGYEWMAGQRAELEGPMQDWAYMAYDMNNPYWLINMNKGKQKQSRIFGTFTANVDIYDGLTFQARFNYDHSRSNSNSHRYATTFLPSAMSRYGNLWDGASRTTEIYTDYLLSYNKTFRDDYSVSASAGWVGHTTKGHSKSTYIGNATYYDPLMRKLPTMVNYFETSAGDRGVTSTSKSSNWDKAYLMTAQFGYKEMVYVDASYRRDWYRPYKIFKQKGLIDNDNFGYFGVGANAIISSIAKLPEWFNFMKYRVSYSEVGNSIPNKAYFAATKNLHTGASTGNNVAAFKPKPETNRSFETGLEMLFFDNRLTFDLTYYNATMSHLYMETTTGSGKTLPLNSARVNNQGIETTIGYDFRFDCGLRWKTSYNVSYNSNEIKETAYDDEGKERLIQQNVAGAHVRYRIGGSIGDMYVGDYKRYEADVTDDAGTLVHKKGDIVLTNAGKPQFDESGKNDVYVGNMNSKWQMGWNNTISYKDFSLSFLINGRIGGKVISLTEGYLDSYGLSERTANARMNAEANNIVATDFGGGLGMVVPADNSGRIVPIKEWYQGIGGSSDPINYIYSATNFRLRELSMGYTFRDLFGEAKNLSVSFIARNLFFLYKDAPVDPDVSLSTANGLGAFEMFNMPSARSFGMSLKVNF